jgi:hypothetical protein
VRRLFWRLRSLSLDSKKSGEIESTDSRPNNFLKGISLPLHYVECRAALNLVGFRVITLNLVGFRVITLNLVGFRVITLNLTWFRAPPRPLKLEGGRLEFHCGLLSSVTPIIFSIPISTKISSL